MAVIAGNWKMHHGPRETEAFFRAFALSEAARAHELVIFPPSVSLPAASASGHRDPAVRLGVQNIHWEVKGAFTGEISAGMAREAGAAYALVGHSERRHLFGESDADVARKTAAAFQAGLVPVVCVGETLDERREGRLEEVILRQVQATLEAARGTEARFMVAYEPVWAIGTGETATPEDAAHAHGVLRGALAEALGASRAASTPILYGGSVKPANAAELLAATDVDGVLVGGASLDPASFLAIAEAAPPTR